MAGAGAAPSPAAYWHHLLDLELFLVLGFRAGAHFSACCSLFRSRLRYPASLWQRSLMLHHLALRLSWLDMQSCLRRITRRRPNGTVGEYCAVLHALRVIPRVTVEIAAGVECHLRSCWRPTYCYCRRRAWTSLPISRDALNRFHFLSTADVGMMHRFGSDAMNENITFLQLLDALVQCATEDMPRCRNCRVGRYDTDDEESS